MEVTNEMKSSIHAYVILELAIQSINHDKKIFESFRVKRPYIALCDHYINSLNEELKQINNSLYRHGIKKENYRKINDKECLYSFMYRGEILPFLYQGEALKHQVERKIMLSMEFKDFK